MVRTERRRLSHMQRARMALGLSIPRIADRLAARGFPVSTSTLRAWERGLCLPDKRTECLPALAEILALTPGELVDSLFEPAGRVAR
jgi:DNA-binding transcriptional regulator YiaG